MKKLLLRRCGVAVLGVLFSGAAWADISGTGTLAATARFNFDTGATVTSAGDILFTGTSIQLQGSAKAFGGLGSGSTTYNNLNQLTLSSLAPALSAAAITPTANQIIAVHTNGGNYAKILITSVSSTSLAFQYTTFGATGGSGGAGAPSITALQNNYSWIIPGLPNYGIAPGSLFIIWGSGLSDPTVTNIIFQSSASPGIPLTLNGASISVTVGGVTTHPAIYYAVPNRIAAVLPSGTLTGSGTITVTYNGVASTPAPIQVVPTALGLDTTSSTGTGLGVATVGSSAIGYNSSASPGQTVTLWGSGLGADTADSDTVYTLTPHSVSGATQIFIGGVLASVSYQGSSGYPGVNQINVQIPQSVQPGCAVSVVAVSGTGSAAVVSNTVTIPVNPGGGVCADSTLGYNGNQFVTLGGKTSYNAGSLFVSQQTSSGTTNSSVDGGFFSVQGIQSASGYQQASIGSCIVNQLVTTSTSPFTTTGLDAGTITVTGPSGTAQQLTSNSLVPGSYFLQQSGAILPSTGGTFTFKGTGGKDVGPFTASLSYASPLTWTNMSSITSINRAQGVTITWTGGASGTYVNIGGSSTSGTTSVSFTCYAPVSAGQFTVPSYVLLALPPSSGSFGGSFSVENVTTPQSFSASGLDYAAAFAAVNFSTSPSYQ